MLHVAHGWPPTALGGTERYAACLVGAQAALGATTRSFGPGAPDWEPPPARRGFRASWDHPEVDAAFQMAMAEFAPDVVHFHHFSGLSLALPRLSRPARVVLTLHDYAIRCARGQLTTGTGATCAGPSPARCARCIAPAGWGGLAAHLPYASAQLRARDHAIDSLLTEVDLILSPSAHLPRRLGVRAEVERLPLLEPIPPRAEPRPGPVRFGFVGTLVPTKGVDRAIAAFARLPAGAGTLTIIGPKATWNGTTAWADALPRPPGVVFLGPMSPVPWADLDVLVFPSIWDENHPLVLVEASAAGVRVVASDVPGARLVAPHARFFAPGSVPGLHAALAAEVHHGRARVPPVAAPTPADHAARLLERYATLLGRAGNPRRL